MSSKAYDWFVGIDWATAQHEVAVVDAEGSLQGQRSIEHSGHGIAEFVDWLLELTGGDPHRIAIAIETPRGALVETLVERGLAVYAINPKQLDRFRDRHTVAGSKDDRRDALVLAHSLRTDLLLFRRVATDDPIVVELREFSRMDDELVEERNRLTNRLREQVYRHFPQLLRLCPAADERWFWDLLELAPTPAQAQRIKPAQIGRVLRQNRIRRLQTKEVVAVLRSRPVHVAPGTAEAASAHIRLLLPRLRLLDQQLRSLQERMKALLDQLSLPDDSPGQKNEHRDAAIVLSVPGIGTKTAATMLAEAWQPLEQRSHHQLRALTGIAPVTRQSGKSKLVLRRRACNPRLANALYHAARVHSQCVPAAKARYALLRQRGHSHGRALRSIADRLLRIVIAMLRDGTLYDTAHSSRPQPAANPG
jgi:transposase